jgi:hypothetical protein
VATLLDRPRHAAVVDGAVHRARTTFTGDDGVVHPDGATTESS